MLQGSDVGIAVVVGDGFEAERTFRLSPATQGDGDVDARHEKKKDAKDKADEQVDGQAAVEVAVGVVLAVAGQLRHELARHLLHEIDGGVRTLLASWFEPTVANDPDTAALGHLDRLRVLAEDALERLQVLVGLLLRPVVARLEVEVDAGEAADKAVVFDDLVDVEEVALADRRLAPTRCGTWYHKDEDEEVVQNCAIHVWQIRVLRRTKAKKQIQKKFFTNVKKNVTVR